MNDYDEDLRRAIEISQTDYAGYNLTEEEAMQRAIELSKLEEEKKLREMELLEKEKQIIEENELMLAQAKALEDYLENIYANLPNEPPIDEENYVDINVKPHDKSAFYSRRFRNSDKIKDLRNFAKLKLKTLNEVELQGIMSKKIYQEDDQTLLDAGFGNKETIIATILK